MIKDISFALSMIFCFSIMGCVTPTETYSHRMEGDDVDPSQYSSGVNDCTQREEVAGECTLKHKHKNHRTSGEDMRIHHGEDAPRYRSSDGYTMISKHGISLPLCNEMDNVSQADNGSKCWRTTN